MKKLKQVGSTCKREGMVEKFKISFKKSPSSLLAGTYHNIKLMKGNKIGAMVFYLGTK